MRNLMIAVIALTWCGAISAQNEKSADAKDRADRLKAIQSELTKATAEAREKIGKITDAAEKRTAQQALTRTMLEMRPKLAEKALALAKENPKDDVGFDALNYALALSANTPLQEKAKALMIENQLGNPRIEEILLQLARKGRDFDTVLLKKVLEKNSAKPVKATVAFIMAQRLKNEAESAKTKDADILPMMKEAMVAFEKVAEDYGDTNLKAFRGKAADLANKEIALIKKSPIGKVTPEITAEDVDGVNFKISDYRGKVILLDFWGHW